MSAQEHDLERGGSEPLHNAFGTGQFQSNNQTPLRTTSTREGLLPSRMGGVRDFQTSPHPSGLVLDSPILAAFRYHIGIYNDPSLSGPAATSQGLNQNGPASKSMGDIMSSFTGAFSASNTPLSTSGLVRAAPNIGIYQRVIAAERKYHREYQIFAMLINGALGLQIIFAAALTALGAGNGPHTAVTAFGALNTVLAGLLTFLKGSGLPNRLKYYENEWQKLREYIEQRERDFASDYHRGRIGWDELAEEIEKIEMMYEGVRKDIEANTPDSYVSMSNAIRNLTTHSTNQQPGLAKGLNRIASKYETAGEDAKRTGNSIENRILSGISEIEHRINKGLGDLEKQTSVKAREVVDNAHDRATDLGKQAEYRVSSAQLAAQGSLKRTQSAGQSTVLNAQNTFQSRLQDTQSTLEARLQNAQDTTQSRLHEAQDVAQTTMSDAQNRAQATLYNAQNTAQSQLSNTQNTIESSLHDAQNAIRATFSDAQHATQSSLQQGHEAAQAELNQTQYQAESKAHDFEDKVALIAEKAAERVLQLTRHRHQ